MATTTSVEVEAGRVVVRRTAADGAGTARLEALGQRLVAAGGAGAVRVVRTAALPGGGWELVTEHAGTPLDLVRAASAAELASRLAAAAEALAALHGAVGGHGDLSATDAVVGPDGRVRWAGLGSAAGAPEDDVARLGRAGLELAAGLPPGPDPDRLRAVLQLAASDDLDRRPTARRLAVDLGRIAPAAAPAPAARSTARRHQLARPVARAGRSPVLLVAVVVSAAVLLLAVLLRPSPREPGGETRREPTATPTGSQPDPPRAPEVPERLGPACVASEGRGVAVADGCPSALGVDGGAVTVDGERWVVGRSGDELLVGDWACSGRPQAARLRPGTGEVLVLSLPRGGDAVVVRAERVEGASGLRAAVGEDGCVQLHVVADGGAVRLA